MKELKSKCFRFKSPLQSFYIVAQVIPSWAKFAIKQLTCLLSDGFLCRIENPSRILPLKEIHVIFVFNLKDKNTNPSHVIYSSCGNIYIGEPRRNMENIMTLHIIQSQLDT